jgi:hypothetical protein
VEAVVMGLRMKILPDFVGADNGVACGHHFSFLKALSWSPDTPPPISPE